MKAPSVPAKAPSKPAKASKPVQATEVTSGYRMPLEVADWIKCAESRITYLRTTVDRLTEENVALRKANKLMEARVMGQSQE